jgi:hypothetical protein
MVFVAGAVEGRSLGGAKAAASLVLLATHRVPAHAGRSGTACDGAGAVRQAEFALAASQLGVPTLAGPADLDSAIFREAAGTLALPATRGDLHAEPPDDSVIGTAEAVVVCSCVHAEIMILQE